MVWLPELLDKSKLLLFKIINNYAGNVGRGAQEVGTCLRKHILHHVPQGTKHLILWSDSCGGQNPNIKIILLLKAVLDEHSTLEDITQHFLVPGLSFLRNDSDYSDSESCLKMQQRLYVPSDFVEVMKSWRRKNKLHVGSMEKEDFVNTEKLEEAITNRKKSITTGDQVNWLKFKVIQVRKSDPETIFIKSDLKQEHLVEINIGKQSKKNYMQNKNKKNTGKSNSPPDQRVVGKPAKETNTKFYSRKLTMSQGKPISNEKLQDLKSMMHLIPKDFQPFYKGLWSSEDVVDDVDGFCGPLDFELESS